MSYEAMLSESDLIRGYAGDPVEAYVARPLDSVPRGGVVVLHHMPGYDGPTKEITRRFAVLGYNAICPNLYWREAPGAAPDDAAATTRALGGVPDDRLVGDVEGAMTWLNELANSNRKVAVSGYCSGGRQAWLANSRRPRAGAIVCSGAFMVGEAPAGAPPMPALGHLAASQFSPVLGLWGNDDVYPSAAQVDEIEALLKDAGRPHEFHRYDGAGHAFFAVDRPTYRPEQAVDGWARIQMFLRETLGG
jgi:carboxymethylenebutenolidase